MEIIAKGEDIHKAFISATRQVQTLKNINFTISGEEFISVVGSSGCGKSTLLNIIAGLIEPTEGRIYMDKEVRDHLGYISQKDSLFPWRTVKDNIGLGLEIKKVPRPERDKRIAELVALVNLNGFEDYFPHQISGGMRQRTSLARSLAYEPKFLLMDEPFGALDALTRTLLQEELLRIWERVRIPILFVTHDLAEAIILADKVLLMSARPGTFIHERKIDLPRPRHALGQVWDNDNFRKIYDEIWAILSKEVAKSKGEMAVP